MFHLFQTYVAGVLSGYCMLQVFVSSVSGVSYVCWKCIIWMLHVFAMVFECFEAFSQLCFRRLCEVFHLSSFVCCIWMFQKRSDAAHGMRVGSG
jgi:hypothetical protein